MMELFLSAFVTLFVVIDPPGCAPTFSGLSADAPPRQQRIMAVKAVLIATLILLGFAIVGEDLLRTLGIGLESFRIAGGIMLFIIALEMVLEKRTQRREKRAEKLRAQHAQTPEIEDISIFPMAMPMIAGPGAIATVMLLVGGAQGTDRSLVVLGMLAAVMAIMLAALSWTFTSQVQASTVLPPAEKQQVAQVLEEDAELMSNTKLTELLAGQPAAIQAEIIRINTEARPFALQIGLLVPLLAGALGLVNSLRMRRLSDPEPSGAAETTLG